MLPLINLKAAELFSFDALSAADSLMPEAASAIDGEFAELMHSNVATEFSSLVPSGELLPESGNLLPPEPSSPAVHAVIPPADLQNPPDATSLAETDAPARVDTLLEQMLGESGRQHGDIKISTAETVATADAMGTTTSNAGLEGDRGVAATADTTELLSVTGLLEPENPASLAHTGPAVAGLHNPVTNARNAEPTERNPQRLQAESSPQQAQSANIHLAASTDSTTPNPVVGQLEPRLNTVAEQLRQQRSRSAVTTQPSSMSRGGGEQPRNLGEDIVVLPPRPVATTTSTPAIVTPEPAIQVDTGPRFGSDLTAALPRQPQAAIPTTVSSTIQLPVQQPGWDTAVADRVTLMANGKLQNAEIRLTPAELGPLKIQLVIDDGTANVSFHAQHAQTREALEQALPRLREMLAENGLQLGQASVGDDGVNQRGRDASENARPAAVSNNGQDDTEAPEQRQAQRLLNGLVDTFA